MEIVCQVCKKKFRVTPNRTKKAKFCSRKCYGISTTGKFIVPRISCIVCKKDFYARPSWINDGARYCSKVCFGIGTRTSFARSCKNCGVEFLTFQARIDQGNGKYCSMTCHQQWQRKKRVLKACKTCSKTYEVAEAYAAKGYGNFCSSKCYGVSISLPWEKVGGIKLFRRLNAGVRRKYEYQKWKQAVLVRDEKTCQHCGSKKNLQVHHRKPMKKIIYEYLERYPGKNSLDHFMEEKILWRISNGLTLCRSCHCKTDSYGCKGNNI